MTIRSTRRSVTFRHPFTLLGLDGPQPAGTYVVETDEELIEAISLPAYRRIATWLRITAVQGRPGVAETAMVDPGDLAAALARDGATTAASP
jgi:hypothetical protein